MSAQDIVRGTQQTFVIVALIVVTALFIGVGVPHFIRKHTHSFVYPMCKVLHLDVTGKREPLVEDCIDRYLIDTGLAEIRTQEVYVQQWQKNCQAEIDKIRWKRERERAQKNYDKCVASANSKRAFCVVLIRKQTRYRQQNYQRQSYTVDVEVARKYCSAAYLKNRKKQLNDIGNVCTLHEYHSKNQRRLMTPALRKAIMERDNYTCQICGKYMPDEVGLQIDHIMPVTLGGKTVADNLQVLCSKCNRRKSSKVPSASDESQRKQHSGTVKVKQKK